MESRGRSESIILFGPPGAGKGTVGAKLTNVSANYHLSTGDIFRGLPPESPNGKVFYSYANEGKLVPDDVTIENAKPVVDSVTLSPEMVYTNDIITVTSVLSDSDASQSGDLNASYSWHVVDIDGNDIEVQSGTDNTLSGVSHFDRDDEVYVVVTPNDGVENGNPATSSSITILNSDFLTEFQEKQMSFQPDMILEYAHYLGDQYLWFGEGDEIQVFADSFVALNGRKSQRFINNSVDLYSEKKSLRNKKWILTLKDEIKGF